MSWYVWIHGEVETSREAEPIIREDFGPWMGPKSEGGVIEMEADKNGRLLRLSFDDMYCNLGQRLDGILHLLAKGWPKETKGEVHLFSFDGDYYHAALRIEDGKLYRRELSELEDELQPCKVKLWKTPVTLYLTAAEMEEIKTNGRHGDSPFNHLGDDGGK